jgi:hypothetical protein
MGLLTDLGNVVTGAIERDRELTNAALEDRKEQLKANRDAILSMKQNRYESEIKAFDEENKKYKAIKAVNDQFDGQEITPSQWGQAYLKATDSTTYNNLIKTYEGDTEGLNKAFSTYYTPKLTEFKLSTTRDAIDNKTEEEIQKINSEYGDKIKNARGDSFLIAQLLGDKNKKINKIEKESTEDSKGIEVAKEVSNESIDNKPNFTVKEEEFEITVPKKWIEDSGLIQLRKEVKKDLGNTKKEAANTTLEVLEKLNISVPKQYLTYEQGRTDAPVTGFKGNGKRLNDQIGLLSNQSFNFQNDLYLYIKSNKKASSVPNVYSTADNKNIITSRIDEYTGTNSIMQNKKTIFADRENFISLVPFSVVGLDDIYKSSDGKNAYSFANADKKAVGEAYFKAVKNIVNKADPEFKLSTEADAMNSLQERLLKLNDDSTNPLVIKVKTEMEKILNIQTEKPGKVSDTNINKGNVNAVVVNGQTIPLTENNKKYLDSINFDYSSAEKVIAPQSTVKQDGGDGSVAEQTLGVNQDVINKSKKIEPSEMGDTTFTNLESVLKVLPRPMTGQEIKDTYQIDFPINVKSRYSPLK